MCIGHRILILACCLAVSGLLAACSNDKAVSSAPEPTAQSPAPTDASPSELPVVDMGSGGAVELAAAYDQRCTGEGEAARECEILRSLLVVEMTTALEQIESARDQRGAEDALAALEFPDEPELFIAACRVLGQFPETPGIAAKLVGPVLESPYYEVQRAAAELLVRTPDPGLADVGRVWSENHGGFTASGSYEEYPDFPPHYASMGFPAYPGAEWFSPADSDRSIGWWTPDDPAKVAGWFAKTLNTTPLGAENWLQDMNKRAMNLTQYMNQSTMQRVQELTEKIMKSQDPAAIAEYEKITKEMDVASQAANKAAENAVDSRATPANSSPAQDALWIIAEEKAGHISRLALVYRMPALERTVIKLIWNLGDYPSAWPPKQGGSY